MNGFVLTRLQSLLKKTCINGATEATFVTGGKALIISPHYDDDVISCYGAMKACSERNVELHVLYITDGRASMDSGLTEERLKVIRKKEAENAVKSSFPQAKLFFLEKKDGDFRATWEDSELITDIIIREKYNYIFCPPIMDTHKDHKESFKLLLWALDKSGHHCMVYFYEFWNPLSNPNEFISLEGSEAKKAAAIACHESQLRFLDYVGLAKTVNEYRGNQLGLRSAEVYQKVLSDELITKKKPKLSVVIPAYNNEDYVRVMLTALLRQKCDFDDWEIVLVDDSEDARMTCFEDNKNPRLRVIEKNHGGRAQTRNVGIRESRGEIIVFIDSDMIVDENFLQSHYNAHKRKNHDIVLGKVNHVLNENLNQVRNLVNANKVEKIHELVVKDNYLDLTKLVFENKSAAENIGWVCCLFSNCSIKREVLEKSGIFDESFIGWGLEDIELGYRFYKNGFHFSYDESIQNYHVDHLTNVNKMLVEMGQNLKRLYAKHPDKAIRSYMCFAAGFKDLSELLNEVAGETKDFYEGSGQYFKPLSYAKSKS